MALNSNCFKPACGGKSSTFLKMTLPQKNSPRIKTPYRYLMNLVSNYLEKNILSNTVKINGIQSRMSLKLRIKVVAFFLGHPVYSEVNQGLPSVKARHARSLDTATLPRQVFAGDILPSGQAGFQTFRKTIRFSSKFDDFTILTVFTLSKIEEGDEI